MILKKQEKDNLVKAIYSSSNICASTYDKSTKDMVIIFSKGSQYQYTGVSESDYMRFELADSQGAVMNTHIKKYPFTKLADVDTKTIINEVATLKSADEKIKINAAVIAMIDKMKAVVTYYDTTEGIESGLLDKVKDAIAAYDKVIEPKLDKVNG
jgi:hypothetical protein